MADKQKLWKHPVLLREVKCVAVKNLLEIEGKILQDEFSFTPIFYLSIFEGFARQDEQKRLSIQFTPFEILGLKTAFKEALSTKQIPKYRNYTGGKENGKWVSVNVTAKDDDFQYSLNFEKKGKLIGMIFNKYEAFAVLDTIEEIYNALVKKRDEIAWSKYIQSFKKKNT